jgi:hypothetical protein
VSQLVLSPTEQANDERNAQIAATQRMIERNAQNYASAQHVIAAHDNNTEPTTSQQQTTTNKPLPLLKILKITAACLVVASTFAAFILFFGLAVGITLGLIVTALLAMNKSAYDNYRENADQEPRTTAGERASSDNLAIIGAHELLATALPKDEPDQPYPKATITTHTMEGAAPIPANMASSAHVTQSETPLPQAQHVPNVYPMWEVDVIPPQKTHTNSTTNRRDHYDDTADISSFFTPMLPF